MIRKPTLETIDLNLVKALTALIEHKNVTLAGRALGLTQSAMSVSLKKLRILFSDDILTKTGNEMIPSQKAVDLAKKANILLKRYADLIEQNFSERINPDLSESGAQPIRLATRDGPGFTILIPHLKNYLESHPSQLFSLKDQLPDKGISQLKNESVDFSFGSVPDSGFPTDIQFLKVAELDFSVLSSSADPKPITIEDYHNRKHILISHEGSLRAGVDKYFGAHLKTSRKIAISTSSFLLSPKLMIDSSYLLTLPTAMARMLASVYPLKVQPSVVPIPNISLFLSWHRRHDRRPDLAAFVEWLKARL